MSTATTEPTTKKPLLPPDEKFWQRYSAHHEFPLAGVTSLFLHGLVIGLLILTALWLLAVRRGDSHKPPRMDMVMIEGGGDGFGGMGAEPGLPGEKDQVGTEAAVNAEKPSQNDGPPDPATANLKEAPGIELNIPEAPSTPMPGDGEIDFEDISKQAKEQANKEPAKPAKPKMPGLGTFAKAGGTNPKGAGGLGGSGGGHGKGKFGSGPGVGGAGRLASKAEILAWRWRFDLTGNGKEHADKLAAVGVTLALPSPKGGWFFIQDLRRRPVELQPGNLDKFQDAVKWQNTKGDSLQALARELQLPFVPQKVIMLLPKDREEMMAEEELQFAKRHNRPPQQIQATWFDFIVRDGAFVPKAINQQ